MPLDCQNIFSRILFLLVGYFLLILSVALPYWASFHGNDEHNEVYTGYEGLWKRCRSSQNTTCCEPQDEVIKADIYALETVQRLAIACMVLGTLAALVIVVGRCMAREDRLGEIFSLLCIATGCMEFVAVGLYMEQVIKDAYEGEHRHYSLCCILVIISGMAYLLPVLASCCRTFCARPTYHNQPYNEESFYEKMLQHLEQLPYLKICIVVYVTVVFAIQITVISLPNWSYIQVSENETESAGLWEICFTITDHVCCHEIEYVTDKVDYLLHLTRFLVILGPIFEILTLLMAIKLLNCKVTSWDAVLKKILRKPENNDDKKTVIAMNCFLVLSGIAFVLSGCLYVSYSQTSKEEYLEARHDDLSACVILMFTQPAAVIGFAVLVRISVWRTDIAKQKQMQIKEKEREKEEQNMKIATISRHASMITMDSLGKESNVDFVIDVDNTWLKALEANPPPYCQLLPRDWSPMGNNDALQVPLDPLSENYVMVQHKFHASMSKELHAEIFDIFRVQNTHLYATYQDEKNVTKNSLQGRCQFLPLDRKLWLSASGDDIPEINLNGFDHLQITNGCYGEGVYFYESAGMSTTNNNYEDNLGFRYMYLADVITGEYVKGERGMAEPPTKPGLPHVTYETVVDDIKYPKTFVVFKQTAAYPTYLVQYKLMDANYSTSFVMNNEPF